MTFREKYIGDRAFYRRILAIAIPIIVQSGITTFVSLLDNIMVGKLSTESMSGVSIVNQFIFIFDLLIFGSVSAAGIFTAQFRGQNDTAGIRHTLRFKLLVNFSASVIAVLLFYFCGDQLINFFLHSGSETGDLALTLSEGRKYLLISLVGLFPFAVSQVYGSTMRETGNSVLPMYASVAAVFTNFALNLLLIFGYLGFPALGVRGAALATVISRFVELFILVIWGHTHKKECPYLVSAYRSLYIPGSLIRKIAVKGLPIMANELLWSLTITLRNQAYSLRGLDAVAAMNITTTVSNFFNVVHISLGTTVGIVMGNLLGAGALDEARDTNRKMIALSVTSAGALGVVLAAIAPFFPMIYNTSAAVRETATYMIVVIAILMPLGAYAHSGYFTLRSGGLVAITVMIDSGFMWAVVVPVSIILSRFTDIGILLLYPICQGVEALKNVIIFYALRSGKWARQLVSSEAASEKTTA